MGEPYHDKDTLERLYHDKDMGGVKIADKFGVSPETIYRWMDKHGIDRTKTDVSHVPTAETIADEYASGLSIPELAEKHDCSRGPIRKRLKSENVEFRGPGEWQTPDELRDKEWLIEQNHDEGKSIAEIARKVECSPNAVHRAFDRHGIENARSNKVSSRAKEVLEDESKLRELYFDEGLSTIKIADRLEVAPSTISHWFDRHGIEARDQSEITGELHPRYKDAEPHVYDKTWRKVREDVIQRDGAECQLCGVSRNQHKADMGIDLDVHHIIPQDQIEDKYDKTNLTTLCRSCHIKTEQEQE